jgi:hypothetical protein
MFSIGCGLIEAWFTRVRISRMRQLISTRPSAKNESDLHKAVTGIGLRLMASKTRGKVLKLGPDSTACSDEYRQNL